MQLVRPTVIYKDSFLEADSSLLAIDGRHIFGNPELDPNAFQEFCNILNSYEEETLLPDDKVHASFFWLIDHQQFIGRISIRHTLSEDLLQFAGQIGYVIAPAYRNKGYGTAILKLGLTQAAKLGLKKVLVTCDTANAASAKIIERNGGVLENELFSEERAQWKKRYWINTG